MKLKLRASEYWGKPNWPIVYAPDLIEYIYTK